MKRIINWFLEFKARFSPYDAYYDADHILKWKRAISAGEEIKLSAQMFQDMQISPKV